MNANTPTQSHSDSRAEFENIAFTKGLPISREVFIDGDLGKYHNAHTELFWEGFQAASQTIQDDVRKDAERYRWFRSQPMKAQTIIVNIRTFNTWGLELDQAIDAAREEE